MYYKVVDTDSGLSIAHVELTDDAEMVVPVGDKAKVRADELYVEFIENYCSEGWGPVDGRTMYRVGEVTAVDEFNDDESEVSGAGLHAFQYRRDAEKWMETADL